MVSGLNGILSGDAGSLGVYAVYIVGVLHRSGLAHCHLRCNRHLSYRYSFDTCNLAL